MGKTVGPLVKVRLVNLENVTGKDHLGPLSGPGYYGFDFVRSKILRLIYDEIALAHRTAAYVRKRLDDEFFLSQHALYLESLARARLELLLNDVEIVHKRLQERRHLGFLVARKISNILIAKHDCRP